MMKINEVYFRYNHIKNPVELENGVPFSGCCGSRYYANSSRVSNIKGIALYIGKRFTEGKHSRNTIKHVETPDGIITIITRDKE